MIILNTRPREYRADFAAAFGGLGLPIIESPVLATEPLAAWPHDPTAYDALIFTSPIAPTLRPDDARWTELPVFAVGPATAASAQKSGFRHVRCTGHTAKDLSVVLACETFRRALYPGAEDVTLDLSAKFPHRVERAVVYRMNPAHALSPAVLNALRSGTRIFTPLFSRRSAEILTTLAQPYCWNLTIVGISANALNVPNRFWGEAITARIPTSESMAAALAEHLNTVRRAA
jgi:uroporphyrinogen-III synthase